MARVDLRGRHEDSSKMLSHFLRAWEDSRKKFNVLREDGAGETPQALKRRGGSPYRLRKAKCLATGKDPPVTAVTIQRSFP